MEKLKYGIIGGGPGGQSMAATLTNKGFSAKMSDIDQEVIDAINNRGKIVLTGKIEMEEMPELVTLDPVKAIEGVDIIMIASVTNAHEDIAKAIAKHVTPNQIIVLNPGMFGGALAFKTALKANGCPHDVVVAQTADLCYACRRVEAGIVFHSGIKKRTALAAVPASKTQEVIDKLAPAFPVFVPAETIWHISMGGGAILHCVPVIMNANKIDLGQHFDYYMEGITPSVARIAEAVDKDRLAVAKAFGFDQLSCADNVAKGYELEPGPLYEVIQRNEAYRGIKSPRNFQHRFLAEDTYGSLAPMASIAKELGIPTPGMDAVLFIIGAATGVDYTTEGRTAEKMGLKGKTLDEIYAMVK